MKSAVKVVHSLRRGQGTDVVLPSVALSASLILGDTIKDCRIISDADSTWIYKLTGVADNYQLWLTEDNEMSIIIDNPTSDLHQHTIFSGSYSTDDDNGVLTHSQDPRIRGDEFRQKFKGESQFFAAIVSISDMIRKDPDRLFYVEHGLDSGEWGPEEEYSLSDYQKILNQVEGAAYGYQINFETETWWGWVSGRSNPGSGTWIEGEGSEEFIARVKRAIHRTSSRP
jgi:hypothetical protein